MSSVQRGVKQVVSGLLEGGQRHHRFLHLLNSETRDSQHLSLKPIVSLLQRRYVMQSANSIW